MVFVDGGVSLNCRVFYCRYRRATGKGNYAQLNIYKGAPRVTGLRSLLVFRLGNVDYCNGILVRGNRRVSGSVIHFIRGYLFAALAGMGFSTSIRISLLHRSRRVGRGLHRIINRVGGRALRTACGLPRAGSRVLGSTPLTKVVCRGSLSPSVHSLERAVICNLGNVDTCNRRTHRLNCFDSRISSFCVATLRTAASSSLAIRRLVEVAVEANRGTLRIVGGLSRTGARACNGPSPRGISIRVGGNPFVVISNRSLGSLRVLLRRSGNGNVGICARNRVLPYRNCSNLGGCPRLVNGFNNT